MARKPTPNNILDDLLGGAPAVVSQETAGLRLYQVPLARLVDNTWQPRQVNDPDHVLGIARSLVELSGSLPETKGLQQPPIGRIMRIADQTPVPAGTYDNPDQVRRYIADPAYVVEMAFGHSRRLAFDVLANGVGSIFPELRDNVTWSGPEFDPATYGEMPLFLLPIDDTEMWRNAVTENAARRDISPIEEARTLRRAVGELGLTIDAAGATLGKSRSAASNLLRLLDLPDVYQEAIMQGGLSETHGRTLLQMRPAMYLVKATPAQLGEMTRRELEAHVRELIARCQPIPTTRTGYAHKSWNGLTENRPVDPVAWSHEWLPDADAKIVGACSDCTYRVTFAGDAGPRCAEPARACFDQKNRQWRAKQIEAQRQAIDAARSATAPATAPKSPISRETPAVAEPTTAAATVPSGKPLVEWTEEEWQAAQEQERRVSQETPAAPPPAADLPPVADVTGQQVSWFRVRNTWGDAPAALLENGLCSKERCECFVLAFNEFADDNHVRPDPEHAPNMCYGCTSANRLARRKQELEHGDLKAARAAIKAQNAACTQKLRDAFYILTAADLWHNTEFMRDLVKAGTGSATNIATQDALTIQERIWMHVAGVNCKRYDTMGVDGDNFNWRMDLVDDWLKRIRTGISREHLGSPWAELEPPPAAAEPAGEAML